MNDYQAGLRAGEVYRDQIKSANNKLDKENKKLKKQVRILTQERDSLIAYINGDCLTTEEAIAEIMKKAM